MNNNVKDQNSFRFYLRGSYTQASIKQLQRQLEQITHEATQLISRCEITTQRENPHWCAIGYEALGVIFISGIKKKP